MGDKVVLSWSSGKDSAHALHRLHQDGVEVVALLTTVNRIFERVAMHAVRRSLLLEQGRVLGLPVIEVPIPHPCSNEMYEKAMETGFEEVKGWGARKVAFADIFLEDIREYRLRMMEQAQLEAVFPIWGEESSSLAREMLESGLGARLTCVDPSRVPREFVGRIFDDALLKDLPEGVDACGENGEFHTFVFASPEFSESIPVRPGEVVEREGFVFADMVLKGERS